MAGPGSRFRPGDTTGRLAQSPGRTETERRFTGSARRGERPAVARDAGLLLVEATGVAPTEELARHGHMTGAQAADLARAAAVGELVLTHLSPWTAARFPGPVTLAQEGLVRVVGDRRG